MTGKHKTLMIKALLAMVLVGSLFGGAACTREVIKEVPKEVIKEVIREVPKEVIKEVPKEVIKEVIKEVPKEVVKEVVKEVIKEVPMNLTATAKAIQEGKVDAGKNYGLGLAERYHKIHSTIIGLDCTSCHISKADTNQTVFNAQDVAPQAPGPVDKRSCLGCHGEGSLKKLYDSGTP